MGPRTASGEASAGCAVQVLRPLEATKGLQAQESAGEALVAGMCHCTICTRVCVDSVQMAQAWAGGVTESEVEGKVAGGAGGQREATHAMQLSLTTVTINDGGVGAVLSMGTIGRSADGVWFKPCTGCKGLAFSSTHPHAFRWLCTDCGLTNVFARWRLDAGECVPPLWSCTWPEHAVMVRVTAAAVDVCFDTRRVLRVPTDLAMVLRDMSLEWGLVSETAMAFATVAWCAHWLRTRSGRQFGEQAMGPGSAVAIVASTGRGGWFIEDTEVDYVAQWAPRTTGTDGDLVSTGFAMDNNRARLERAMEESKVAPAEGAGSADVAAEQESAADAEPSGYVRVKPSIIGSAWVHDR